MLEKQDSQCTHNLLRTTVARSHNVFTSSAILTSDTILVEDRAFVGPQNRRQQWNSFGSYVKCPVFLCDFKQNLDSDSYFL